MANRAYLLPLLLLVALAAGCPHAPAESPAAPASNAVAPSPAPSPAPPPAALPVANALIGNSLPTPAASSCGLTEVDQSVRDVSFTSVKGEPLTLATLKDLKKVVLIDFWGMACSACVENLDAYQKDPDFVGNAKLEIIAVSRDTNKTAVKQFATEHGWKFPVVLMTPEIQKALLTEGQNDLPQVRLLDQQSHLRYRIGSTDATHEKVKCAVDGLMGK
jgi:hypothetical protein